LHRHHIGAGERRHDVEYAGVKEVPLPEFEFEVALMDSVEIFPGIKWLARGAVDKVGYINGTRHQVFGVLAKFFHMFG
jgi:hypothetical protein